MILNQIKCPHCDKNLSNVSMSNKQMWLILPFLLIGFLPLIKIFFFKPDASKDLAISEYKTKVVDGDTLEILGVITNSSKREWSSVSVEAEFYSKEGEFLDEENQYVRGDIAPNSNENFKITLRRPPELALNGTIQPKLTLSGGHTSSF